MKKKASLRKTKRENDEARKENEKLNIQLVRALADYDNLRKRVDKEREDFGSIGQARLMMNLLPVFDMLYDAQAHLEDQGLAIAIQTMEVTLKEDGFEKIEPRVGSEFGEEEMEAVEVSRDEKLKNGSIVGVILRGWKMMGGPVIRPAKVQVNKLE